MSSTRGRRGGARSVRDCGRQGRRGVGLRRHALPRLLEHARQRQHRSPASEGHRRDQAPGRPARDRGPRIRQPHARRGGQAHPRQGRRGHFSKVFFTNGGADANENAIRMARLTTGRDTVLSHYRSYHGNTGAAIVSTGDWRRIPNQYARGHVHFFGPSPTAASSGRTAPSRNRRGPCGTSSGSSNRRGSRRSPRC